MSGIGVGILGLGVALPAGVERFGPWTAPPAAPGADILGALDAARDAMDPEVAARKGGSAEAIDERRVLGPDERLADLEAAAALAALADAGVDPCDVGLLMVACAAPDDLLPSSAAAVAARAGLPHHAAAMVLFSGAASLVVQLATAARLVAAGEHRFALLVQSSGMTRLVDPGLPASRTAGDAAPAAVGGPVPAGHGSVTAAHRTHGELHGAIRAVARRAGASEPSRWWEEAAVTIQVTDPAAMMRVAGRGATLCRDICLPLVALAGGPDGVAFLATSQPTGWFADMCCEALGLPAARTLTTFRRVGHTFPCNLVLNLAAARDEGRLQPGDAVLLYSPALGHVQAAALLVWA